MFAQYEDDESSDSQSFKEEEYSYTPQTIQKHLVVETTDNDKEVKPKQSIKVIKIDQLPIKAFQNLRKLNFNDKSSQNLEKLNQLKEAFYDNKRGGIDSQANNKDKQNQDQTKSQLPQTTELKVQTMQGEVKTLELSAPTNQKNSRDFQSSFLMQTLIEQHLQEEEHKQQHKNDEQSEIQDMKERQERDYETIDQKQLVQFDQTAYLDERERMLDRAKEQNLIKGNQDTEQVKQQAIDMIQKQEYHQAKKQQMIDSMIKKKQRYGF